MRGFENQLGIVGVKLTDYKPFGQNPNPAEYARFSDPYKFFSWRQRAYFIRAGRGWLLMWLRYAAEG